MLSPLVNQIIRALRTANIKPNHWLFPSLIPINCLGYEIDFLAIFLSNSKTLECTCTAPTTAFLVTSEMFLRNIWEGKGSTRKMQVRNEGSTTLRWNSVSHRIINNAVPECWQDSGVRMWKLCNYSYLFLFILSIPAVFLIWTVFGLLDWKSL